MSNIFGAVFFYVSFLTFDFSPLDFCFVGFLAARDFGVGFETCFVDFFFVELFTTGTLTVSFLLCSFPLSIISLSVLLQTNFSLSIFCRYMFHRKTFCCKTKRCLSFVGETDVAALFSVKFSTVISSESDFCWTTFRYQTFWCQSCKKVFLGQTFDWLAFCLVFFQPPDFQHKKILCDFFSSNFLPRDFNVTLLPSDFSQTDVLNKSVHPEVF